MYMGTKDADKEDIPPFMRELCPGLSEDELRKATDNLMRYIELATRIHLRDIAKGNLRTALTDEELEDMLK
ncbi:MAG: hypothetical protein AB2787_03595 [Candidatus Thiodiazotropha endolucinida]